MTEMITSPVAEVAGYLKQWMFDPNHPHHPLRAKPDFAGPADRNTNLKNSFTRKFLQWEEQTFGINLGWTDDASPATAVRVSRWFFTRPADDSSPIRYGQWIALGYGVSPSYVSYAERTSALTSTGPRCPGSSGSCSAERSARRSVRAIGWPCTTRRLVTA